MKIKLLGLVLVLQSLWFAGTIGVQEWKLSQAATVLLETAPVDPRDLLRGDFVILNYKISRLDKSLFVPPLTDELNAGTMVYVHLKPVGEFHEANFASLTPPEPGSGLFVQGHVVNPWRLRLGQGTAQDPVRVEYGLERYYVREGTGEPRGKLTALISVPTRGDATIKQVFLDGKPYAEAMKSQVPR